MAIWTIRTRDTLESPSILAPERYDPRRASRHGAFPEGGSVLLGAVATSVRRAAHPAALGTQPCLVLDTSDSREGVVMGRRCPVAGSEIGSVKKRAEVGEVIISRLRPYLRQVAWVDAEIPHWTAAMPLLCSTEYYVLRSVNSQSIAFLVPYLLSASVQQVLAASQEGGHHPRFDERTLLTLPLPRQLLEQRESLSAKVEASVRCYRQAERDLCATVEAVESWQEARQVGRGEGASNALRA